LIYKILAKLISITMEEHKGEDSQMSKITEEKTALRRQLIALVILSIAVSAMFYGITLLQNPYKQ